MTDDSNYTPEVQYQEVRNWKVMYKPQVTDDPNFWWVYIFKDDVSVDLTRHPDLDTAKRHVKQYWGGDNEQV